MSFSKRFCFTLRRYLAVLIDYLIFALWAGVVFLSAPLLAPLFSSGQLLAQLSGFVVLVLPLALYLFFFEKSPWQATPGKKLMRLKVVSLHTQAHITTNQAFLRVLVRILPWEFAHFGIWSAQYSEDNTNLFANILMMCATVFLFVEIIFPFIRKNGAALHDLVAKTEVLSSTS